MRGRTLNQCFVVIDEAQNCTYGQLKMLLTRLGWRSTMVLTGDPDQTGPVVGPFRLRRHRRPAGTDGGNLVRMAPDRICRVALPAPVLAHRGAGAEKQV